MREGESATLAVQATSPDGSPLTYAWLRNGGVNAGAGTDSSTTLAPRAFRPDYAAETWQVQVGNAAGTTASTLATVTRVNRAWTDAGTAHPEQDYASAGSEGSIATHVDPAGRTHVVSVHHQYQPSFATRITFKGHSKNSDGDAWGYSAALPTVANGQVSRIQLSSTWTGELVAVWHETAIIGSSERQLVRAALYRPGASAEQAGSWQALGTVSDETLEATEPAVVNLSAGAFGLAWLQRPAAGQPRDAVMRRFTVPDAGAAATSGLGAVAPIETVQRDISRLQLVDGQGLALALLFLEAAGAGTPAKWQYSHGNAALQWTATADLAVDDRFERFHWAPPINGVTVLATADAVGRLYTRRVDLGAASFIDAAWGYNANAYASAPALLIDGEGRIDVFGVSVNTAAGNSSVLAHWVFQPASGWAPAEVLVQSSTNFAQGLGLRGPVVGRDGAGNLLLGWLEKPADAVPQAARSMRFSAATRSWTSAVDIATPPATLVRQSQLSLGVSLDGRATAAWNDAELGGSDRVQHARLR